MFFAGKNDASATPAPSQDTLVFDVTDTDFEAKVLAASMTQPVIVDFWAPWCGPCKQLMPVLEKAVAAAGGAVLLAKVNVDASPSIAAALRVQSVPTVYAFFQGRPLDGFQGALPESQIKAFVDRLVQVVRQSAPDAVDIPDVLKKAADALAAGDAEAAQSLYMLVLEQDENNVQAYVGIVRALIAAGQIDAARETIDAATETIAKHPGFAEARSALELAEATPSAGALGDLEARVARNADDHQARYDLAAAQFAAGQKEQAMDNLILIIRNARTWNDEAARKLLIKFFEALGPVDPLTLQGRRKLSSVLFS